MKLDSAMASIQKIISCELLVLILFVTQSTITDLADLGSIISLRRYVVLKNCEKIVIYKLG